MAENFTSSPLQKNLSVLISGGSGLIGRNLTSALQAAGHKVSHLSRNPSDTMLARTFLWDPEKMYIDKYAFEDIDCIIHLAGENIGEKRWTKKRKEEIIKSRVETAKLLFNNIMEKRLRLKAFISASATGIYGAVTTGKIFSETDFPANDFLGNVCKQWEDAADLFKNKGIRTVKIRSGVVLEKRDSALSKMMQSARFGYLFETGTGLQFMPWIHITDLCRIYLKAVEDSAMSGAYNGVAPQHVTHKHFMNSLERIMKRPVFPASVPGFALRMVLGEMSDIILKGSRVSSEKILLSGYKFLFSTIEEALTDILIRRNNT